MDSPAFSFKVPTPPEPHAGMCVKDPAGVGGRGPQKMAVTITRQEQWVLSL